MAIIRDLNSSYILEDLINDVKIGFIKIRIFISHFINILMELCMCEIKDIYIKILQYLEIKMNHKYILKI